MSVAPVAKFCLPPSEVNVWCPHGCVAGTLANTFKAHFLPLEHLCVSKHLSELY